MNFGQKALQVLKTVAPTLATAVGGPLAGYAVSAVTSALGTPPGDQKAAEAALLSATPDTLLALRKGEQEFTARMRELGISEEQLVFQDVANARAREIAVHDNTPKVLAYLVIAFTGIIEGYALLHGLPEAIDKVIVGRILGTLDSASILVLGYYFGSTLSSRKKDDTIAEIAKS